MVRIISKATFFYEKSFNSPNVSEGVCDGSGYAEHFNIKHAMIH